MKRILPRLTRPRLALALAGGLVLFAAAWPLRRESPPQPEVSSGRLITIPSFPSEYIAPRPVRIWLPDGYGGGKRYSVLYMHDGQMLWDAKITWNQQEWGVDEVAGELLKAGKLRDFIVVATDSIADLRYRDYFPQKVIGMGSAATQKFLRENGLAEPNADNYLKYLVGELKPHIDARFSTKPDRANTMIAGSSMGGLISIYAIGEYPEVFGAAACLSTHWPGANPDEMGEIPGLFVKYMREKLPRPGREGFAHRIYFDYGDQTLDQHYPPLQKKVDALMIELGYDESNWITVFGKGDEHDEIAWNRRLPGALRFLLGRRAAAAAGG